jgi:hypothetical protein
MRGQWRGSRLFRLSLTLHATFQCAWRPAKTTRDDNGSRRLRRSRPQHSPPSKAKAKRSARQRRPLHVPSGRWHRPGATHGRRGMPAAKPAGAPRSVLVGVRTFLHGAAVRGSRKAARFLASSDRCRYVPEFRFSPAYSPIRANEVPAGDGWLHDVSASTVLDWGGALPRPP